MIEQDELKELFEYRDGKLLKKGKKTGWVENHGYHRTTIKGKKYLTHRLVYMYHHGECPKELDHINGDKLDNRIENLRPASRQQNMVNTKTRSESGYKGVYKQWNKWAVQLRVEGKTKWFGSYYCIKEAAKRYNEVALKYHGKYAQLNQI